MNRHQRHALDHHCRLSIETMLPGFGRLLDRGLSAALGDLLRYVSPQVLADEVGGGP